MPKLALAFASTVASTAGAYSNEISLSILKTTFLTHATTLYTFAAAAGFMSSLLTAAVADAFVSALALRLLAGALSIFDTGAGHFD